MIKYFNDKNLLKNLLKAVKELTEVLKKTNLTKNLENYDNLKIAKNSWLPFFPLSLDFFKTNKFNPIPCKFLMTLSRIFGIK